MKRLDVNANVDYQCYRVADANVGIDSSYRYRLSTKISTTEGPRVKQNLNTTNLNKLYFEAGPQIEEQQILTFKFQLILSIRK